MKKIILCSLAILSIATGFSQEKERKGWFGQKIVSQTAGLTVQAGHFGKIGAFIDEYHFDEKRQKYSSFGFQFSYAGTSTNFNTDYFGTGWEGQMLWKNYFSKNKNYGFYSGSGITSGRIEFDEQGYYGRYRYFSILNPEIGYEFLIAKKVRVNLLAGTQWQIEVKGKGDVDNKDFDNWVHRLGLRVSYDF